MTSLKYDFGERARIPYTNAGTTTLASGAVVELTSCVGIVVDDIAPSGTGVLELGNAHTLAKASGAITQGQQLYWSGTALTTASTGNPKAGVALAAAATAATTAIVWLNRNG